MKTGEVVKYIRTSKKLLSKNVYQNILSKPAISKFEKGESDTTTFKFFKILNNLNITLTEFYIIYNDFTETNDDIFFSDYLRYFNTRDLTGLENLSGTFKTKYESTRNLKFYHYFIMTDLTISGINNENPSTKHINELKKYLLNCDNWTHYEIVLFSNTIDYFSYEIISTLYSRIKKKLLYLDQINHYRNDLFALITNILVKCIQNFDVISSRFFYTELIQHESDMNNKMYEKTMIIFLGEIIKVIENPKIKTNKLDEIIAIFDLLDMPNKKYQCIQLYEFVKKIN